MVVAVDADIKDIEIFRSGRHTSSNGTTLSFTNDHLQQIADSYDPTHHEAPVIVGHAYGTSPAYGWIQSLKVAGDRLVAKIKDLDPQFEELVKARRYSKISSGLYTPDSPSNPYPGRYSLREVSFLGAQPPAIKGLKPVEFAEEKGVLNFDESLSFMGNDRYSITLFQRLRDYLIEKESLETADKIIPADYLQILSEDSAHPDYQYQQTFEMLDRLMMRVNELENKFSTTPIYKENMPDETTEKPNLEIEFAEREAKLNATAAELSKQAQKIAARQAELDRKEDLDFCESLIKEGRALPAEKEKLVTMLGAMRKSETVVEFGENDKPQMLDAFKDMLAKRPPLIAFGEHSKPEDKPKHSSLNFSAPEGLEVDGEALEIHEKALAYQEQHPNVTYIQAIALVGG